MVSALPLRKWASRAAELEEACTALEIQVKEQRSIRDQWVTRLEELEAERGRLQEELAELQDRVDASTQRLRGGQATGT